MVHGRFGRRQPELAEMSGSASITSACSGLAANAFRARTQSHCTLRSASAGVWNWLMATAHNVLILSCAWSGHGNHHAGNPRRLGETAADKAGKRPLAEKIERTARACHFADHHELANLHAKQKRASQHMEAT
jgi:hypothetical protein